MLQILQEITCAEVFVKAAQSAGIIWNLSSKSFVKVFSTLEAAIPSCSEKKRKIKFWKVDRKYLWLIFFQTFTVVL